MLEVIVSRANFISAHTERSLRIVALSTALANARDLANWLNIKEVIKNEYGFNFFLLNYYYNKMCPKNVYSLEIIMR